MSETPIFDRLLVEQTFRHRSGPLYTEDNKPPAGQAMTLENPDGQRLRWTGKRWYNPETCDGSLQTQDCWPPYDYGPVLWREMDVP